MNKWEYALIIGVVISSCVVAIVVYWGLNSNGTIIDQINPSDKILKQQDIEIRAMVKAQHEGNETAYMEHLNNFNNLDAQFDKLYGIKEPDMSCINSPAYYNGTKDCG